MVYVYTTVIHMGSLMTGRSYPSRTKYRRNDEGRVRATDGHYPSQLMPKFIFRLPPDLKEWLRDTAEAEGRSMNSQLVQILESARAMAKKGGPA